MVVSGSPGATRSAASAEVPEDETKPELRYRRRGPSTISTDSLAVQSASQSSSSISSSLSMGSSGASFAVSSEGPEAPAALSASGVFRPMPGVHREVTGLFFADLDAMNAKSSSSRIWYAAIDARPRGPFSASEMVSLAEKGKIRESTLVWRPGFRTWQQVRAESGDDLSWLKKIVGARKLRERDAQVRAEAKLGIKPVTLTRTSSGRRPGALSTIPGMPPLPPDDADDVRTNPAHAAVSDDDHPALTSGSFLWRADDMPVRAPTVVRRRQSSTLALLGIVALITAVAAGGMVATKMHALERAAALIRP